MVNEVEIEKKIDVVLEVICYECNSDLNVITEVDSYGDIIVKVDPCVECQEKLWDEAFHEGCKEGYNEGYDAGLIGDVNHEV